MNIQNISALQNTTSYHPQISKISNQKKIYNTNNYPDFKSLNFSGKYNSQVIKNLIDTPIQNDREFYRVIRRVKYSKIKADNISELLNPFRDRAWISRMYKKNFPAYKKASGIEMGLIPYCGENDNSEVINLFLSGRLEKISSNHYVRMPQNIHSCVDVVRALDYSLKKLDNEFGKYDGIVYRVGYMSEEGKQYFSTSKSLNLIEKTHPTSYQFNPHAGYSVIKLKNGHKIYEFQKKMGSRFAKTEEEVLTDRNSKFRKLLPEELDEELINAKQELAKKLFIGADEVMAGVCSNYYKYDRESLLRFINVYEEI